MKDDKKNLYFAGIILLITICCPLIQQGIMCNDELLSRIWSQKGMSFFFRTTIITEGFEKGRALLSVGNLRFLSYLSDNKYIYRSIGILFILASVYLFGKITFKLFNNKKFSTCLIIFILIFLPITFELSVPNAHIITCIQPMILLELSILLFINYLDTKKKSNIIYCIILYLWSMFLYEFLVTYVFLFPVIFLLKYKDEKKKFLQECIKAVWPIICIVIVYLIMYMLQSKLFPTNYEGNTLKIPTISEAVRVFKTVFVSALPGYFTLFNEKYVYLFRFYNGGGIGIKNIYNTSLLVFFVTSLYILLRIFIDRNDIEEKSGKVRIEKRDMIIIGVSILYAFIPVVPNALSVLYQKQVSASGFISIPVSIYIYYANMFTITYIVCKIFEMMRKKFIKLGIILFIIMCAGYVQIENRVFAEEQSNNYDRIVAIEDMLKMEYWKQFDNVRIEAPGLYETKNTLAIEEGHWTRFAEIYNPGMTVDSKDDPSPDLYLQIQPDNSFYLYGDQWAVYFSKKEVNGNIYLKNIDNDYVRKEINSCINKEGNYNIYTLK